MSADATSPTTPRLRLINLRSQLAGPFDLSAARGECLAISGPSGAGKSLLLRMIADLDPNQGQVLLDGRQRQDFTPPEWRRQVAYSAAEPGWWAESVAAHFGSNMLAAARGLSPRLGLSPELLEAPVIRLSTGERQRLALIRTLVPDPPVLLLDEPTGALDQDSTALVEAMLRERLAAGVTILLVSHSPEQAARLGHRRFRLENRQLVET